MNVEDDGISRKKRLGSTSCWSKSSSKYYTITAKVNSLSLSVTAGGGVPMGTYKPNISDFFLWQLVPYSNQSNDFYVIYNKQTNYPLGLKASDYMVNNAQLTCSPTQKFKIVGDTSGVGCNIFSADGNSYWGIIPCGSNNNLSCLHSTLRGTNGNVESFLLQEQSLIFLNFVVKK